MGAKTITETENSNEIILDDVSNQAIAKPSAEAVDMNKLAALRAKSQAKQMEQQMNDVAKKPEKSINIGVIGSGQCGSKIGAALYKLGYEGAICFNTASQDLKHIDLPDANKFLFTAHSTIGGAARELSIGEAAAEAHRSDILQLVNEKLADSQVNMLCVSLGGGSGAGSCMTMLDVLSGIGKPIVVLCVLPMHSEDVKLKSNALETLNKLSEMTQKKVISNLIVADNSKIEAIYSNISQIDFYNVANKSIVSVLDTFNSLSCLPSPMKPLDSAEFAKLLVDSGGLTVYGEMTVKNYVEDVAIAEAVISNMSSNLLAEGFDLRQAKYVGVMVAANKETWDRIPSSSMQFAITMIGEAVGAAEIFRGYYVVDSAENTVKIYTYVSGLGLPIPRTNQLLKDTQELKAKAKDKEDNRSVSLKLDTGNVETISQAEKIKEKIAAKSSSFGKMMGPVTDRRK